VATHAQPGGHWLELVQDGTLQSVFSAQKQQPSTVTKQQQQPLPPGHRLLHAGQLVQPAAPAGSEHSGDGWAAALAVDAVSIEPAPTAAAPTPARLSRRPLVTRVSDTAMQTSRSSRPLY
jgi:hypothetical protein